MIKVKAFITLYKSKEGRKTAFVSGYRPLFNFIDRMKTSGQITLINRKELPPGDNDMVEIAFLSAQFLGDDFDIGTRFTFGEGAEPLGEGEIIYVYKKRL